MYVCIERKRLRVCMCFYVVKKRLRLCVLGEQVVCVLVLGGGGGVFVSVGGNYVYKFTCVERRRKGL